MRFQKFADRFIKLLDVALQFLQVGVSVGAFAVIHGGDGTERVSLTKKKEKKRKTLCNGIMNC
jgi:hypothetical protein